MIYVLLLPFGVCEVLIIFEIYARGARRGAREMPLRALPRRGP